MKLNVRLLFGIITALYLGIPNGYAQEVNKDKRIKYGGIILHDKDQKILDQVNVAVTYKCTFAVKKGDGSIGSMADTLLLAMGDTYSTFINPLHKSLMERQRQGRLSRAKKATAHEVVEDLSSVLDLITASSNYTEDDPGNPIQILKNRITGEVSSLFNSYGANIRHDQKIKEMNDWEITEETDSVLGHFCQKAHVRYGGREYEAWFTPDIPINDGPWKLWGLPGLILKATDKENLFSWIAIGIQKVDGDIVIDDRDYDQATLSQFYDYVQRETGTMLVEFFNQGTLYHAEKKRGYSRVAYEKVTK